MADKTTKDIDFDELHEAVNALMDKAQKNNKPKIVNKTTDIKADEPKTMQPTLSYENTKSEDDKIQVNVKRNTPVPSVKLHGGSHGRAMDVIGPVQKPEIVPPSAGVKHQAPTLRPTRPIKLEESAPALIVPERQPLQQNKEHADSNDLNEALATLNAQESESLPSQTGQTMTHQKSEWPDPLDLHLEASRHDANEPDEPKEEPVEEHEAVESSDSPPTIKESAEEPEVAESSSPFVTTKVEKRPLGAYADSAQDQESKKPSKDRVDKSNDQTDMPNPLPAQPQPEELSPAVVAVESSEQEFTKETSEPISDDAEKPDLRTISIPQQYKEPKSDKDDSARPVFDTKEYHPAIEAHSSTHRSSLGTWVMAIVLLGLLVGILGAAYYFLTGGLDFSALFSYKF